MRDYVEYCMCNIPKIQLPQPERLGQVEPHLDSTRVLSNFGDATSKSRVSYAGGLNNQICQWNAITHGMNHGVYPVWEICVYPVCPLSNLYPRLDLSIQCVHPVDLTQVVSNNPVVVLQCAIDFTPITNWYYVENPLVEIGVRQEDSKPIFTEYPRLQ